MMLILRLFLEERPLGFSAPAEIKKTHRYEEN